MNVKRRHLDRLLLFRELGNHFPPGCWGFCDSQRVYIEVDHEIHVPLNVCFFIKGLVWKTVEAEWLPHVHTLRVTLHRVKSSVDMSAINRELAR